MVSRAHIHIQVLLLLAVVAACTAATTQRSEISDELLEKSLKDKRYMERQLKCALGKGPCDLIGRRIKTFAPLVLRNACPQCTEKETKQIKFVLSVVQKDYPEYWRLILDQYATG